MLKLMKYLKGSIIVALIAPLMMMLEVSMDLLQPKYLQKIIDIGLAENNISYVWSTGGKMIMVALLGIIGGVGCTVFSVWAATSFGARLRQDMFNKIQSFSFAEIDKFSTSSLITRVTNDVTQVQNTVMMMMRIMVRSPLLCIGGVIMAFTLSKKLSMIFIVAMPILIVFVFFTVKKAFPLFSKVQQRIDRVNNVMRENLMGVRVIKAYVSHKKEKERFYEANTGLKDISIKAQKSTILLWPFVTFVMNISVVAVLWIGGNNVMKGTMDIGIIMAFINYLTQILSSLMMVSMLIINFSRAKASADRLNEILEAESSIVNIENPKTPESLDIEFKNVSFKYYEEEEEEILKNISFKVKEGETVGIIGATGSGKSTLISLILRLYDTTDGQVLIGGEDIKNVDLNFIKNNIGVVLQDNILFSGTIEENIKWGNINATKEELEEAAKTAQAYEFIAKKEKGFESIVEQRGKNLSGGQKQRLAIARVMVKKPRVMIMDDSTSALDMATEAKLQQALREKMGKCTLFIIAQRISSVIDADKIIVLDNGRISAIGNHKELIKSNEIYRDFVQSQRGKEALISG